MRRHLIIYMIMVCCIKTYAADLSFSPQDNDSTHHVGFSLSAMPARLIVMDSWQRKWQRNKQSFSLAAEVNYSATPNDSNAFASDYNYPIFGFGLKLSRNDVTMHRSPDPAWGMAQEVDYDSRLGNLTTAYATFTRPLYRDRHWMFDYMLGAGISWGKHKYNNPDNIDNELTGSRFLVYFTGGAHATYRFARDWGVSAGVEFFHHSNGALNRPNKGANFLGPMVALRYMPYYSSVDDRQTNIIRKPFEKRLYANLTLGIGGKTLNEDWQLTQFHTHPDSANYRTNRFHFYTAYSAQADLMYRYARRWASGVGADLFYGTYADRVEAIDQQAGNDVKHSPWSVGLAFKHHVYYQNWSAAMSVGYYLYRHMGVNAKEIEKPYYERIGIHYTFPALRGLTIGFNIKAHLTKADLTEFIVSYPIEL